MRNVHRIRHEFPVSVDIITEVCRRVSAAPYQ